jgi:hypothetical protein
MNEEIWKVVDGFKKYEVSSFGNVKNIKSQKILKPRNNGEYLDVSLSSDNGKFKTLKIHRIVALNFLENIDDKKTVNHMDHDPSNNNVENLEWASITEQNHHKRKSTKEVKESIGTRAVWRIDPKTNEKIQFYKSLRIAALWVFNNKLTTITEFNGGNNITSSICRAARGKTNSSFGYKWIYCDENDNKYTDEIWKNISEEFINKTKGYQISNYGRVKNSKGRISKEWKNCFGYKNVGINPKIYLIHRLVAQVFIPNPDNKEFVNHIDGNKENAYVNNLEWVTRSENVQHAYDTGLTKTRAIIQYDLKMNKIKEFSSIIEASRELNLDKSNIGHCCNNKRNRCGKFIFKYKEEKLNEDDLNEDDLNEDDLNEDDLNEEIFKEDDLNEEKINEESLIEEFNELNLKTGY